MLYENKRLGRLRHGVPVWVDQGNAVFHVRVRLDRRDGRTLTDGALARSLLDSVVFYAIRGRWWPHLFLLMPDHWHALLTFPPGASMSRSLGDWKRWHARVNQVTWQEGYFDHRLRREESLEHTIHYIRNNPVVRGLCASASEWPWRVTSQDVRTALESGATSADELVGE